MKGDTDLDLHAELWAATKRARRPLVGKLNISPKLATAWGFGRVEFFGRAFYQPAEDGRFALIVAVVEYGDTIDLAAIDLETGRAATRLGYGRLFGFDAIDRARREGTTILLFERAFDWLRNPDGTAFIIDWPLAAHLLAADLGDWRVRCSSRALAARVRRALSQPLPLPRIEVPA